MHRTCIRDIILVDSGCVVWRRLLNRERRILIGVNRWRLIGWVKVAASFVAFRFVEHRSVFWRIPVDIGTIGFGDFISVSPDSCRDLCLRLGQNIVRKLHIVKGTRAGGVFNTHDLIIIHILRNGHHFIVHRTCFGNVSLGVCHRCGRNSASSRLGDKVLVVVNGRRRNRSARLSIQSIIVIRNVALRC